MTRLDYPNPDDAGKTVKPEERAMKVEIEQTGEKANGVYLEDEFLAFLTDKELTALMHAIAKMQGYKLLKEDDAEWLLGLISKLGGAVGPFSTLGKETTDRLTRIEKLLEKENET